VTSEQIFCCAAPLRPLVGRLITRIRSRFTEPIQRLQSTSTKGDDVQSVQQPSSHATEKGDDIPELQTIDQFLIDLEGIRTDDGYGYSVTIQGPPRNRRPILGRVFKQLADSEQKSVEKDGINEGLGSLPAHDPKRLGFKINTTSSYSINTEYRDQSTIPRHKQRRSSLSAEEMEERIEEASQGLFDLSLLNSSDASPHR
jgi:hypothetical protein